MKVSRTGMLWETTVDLSNILDLQEQFDNDGS
jgi:hypothetical protein